MIALGLAETTEFTWSSHIAKKSRISNLISLKIIGSTTNLMTFFIKLCFFFTLDYYFTYTRQFLNFVH